MVANVLIADDSEFMRNLLREILAEDHEVVGEAENGEEVVDLYGKTQPDIVLMDIVMPIRDGIDATAAIRTADPEASIVMCTSVGQEEKMKAAIRAGAEGYITKPFQKPSVMQAIDDVLSASA